MMKNEAGGETNVGDAWYRPISFAADVPSGCSQLASSLPFLSSPAAAENGASGDPHGGRSSWLHLRIGGSAHVCSVRVTQSHTEVLTWHTGTYGDSKSERQIRLCLLSALEYGDVRGPRYGGIPWQTTILAALSFQHSLKWWWGLK